MQRAFNVDTDILKDTYKKNHMCLTNGNLAGSKLEIKDFTMGSIESEAGHVTV